MLITQYIKFKYLPKNKKEPIELLLNYGIFKIESVKMII